MQGSFLALQLADLHGYLDKHKALLQKHSKKLVADEDEVKLLWEFATEFMTAHPMVRMTCTFHISLPVSKRAVTY